MITHCNKQIKKQLPTPLHLHLHRPTPLKCTPGPNNQRQVMRPQLGLCIWRVGVRVPRTGEDRVALDTGVETLFAEGEALEGWEVVFCCGAAGNDSC